MACLSLQHRVTMDLVGLKRTQEARVALVLARKVSQRPNMSSESNTNTLKLQ